MTRTAMATLVAALLVAALAVPAEARHRKPHRAESGVASHCLFDNSGRQTCPGPQNSIQGHRMAFADANGSPVYDGRVLGGRPQGCPHRFCGCGLSIKVFGHIRPELNLALNWIRYFPRASPAPGMAAARRGHVMGLLSHVQGDQWLVYDANSGGGKIREHVRSIRGYVIVNPYAGKTAAL